MLSCRACNGNEKRDRDWEEFIREKRSELAAAVIRAWTTAYALSPEAEALLRTRKSQADELVAEVASVLDAAHRQLRFK